MKSSKKLKHPPGLSVLFLTEMWERFGFYIIQGLLILYMTNYFHYDDNKGYTILGAFTALVYISPVFGGFVADYLLGFRKTIIIGNILLALGYALLVIPIEQVFYPALAITVAGTGFFKPNISSFLGAFYKKDDPLRESGFTIFYMGINLGILFATTTVGFVQQKFGWHVSFAMAAVGILIGLATFLVGQKRLKKLGLTPVTVKNSKVRKLLNNWNIVGLTILLIFISFWLIKHGNMANLILWCGSLALVAWLVYVGFSYPKIKRNKLLALIFLIITSIVFWSIYFQMFFSLNLFIERVVDRHWFGIEIPTIMFIGLESLFIFLLGPFFVWLWRTLHVHKIKISAGLKFALATFAVGFAFVWVILGIYLSGLNLVNPLWIVLAYLFVTVGELLLSPIGLALVTVLSPANMVGTMMGVWFVALGLGGKLAGIIATQSSIPSNITAFDAMKTFYLHAFGEYAAFALVVGFIILLFVPVLRKLARGENLR